MRVLIVAYIKFESLLEQVEGIISYYKLQTTETNQHFRTFSGHCSGSPVNLFRKIYQQMEDLNFDIEDSIFMTYPCMSDSNSLNLSTLVFKRKGNRHLRRLELR
jgi:hypothetical protein